MRNQMRMFSRVVSLLAAFCGAAQAGLPPNGFTTIAEGQAVLNSHPNFGENPKLVLDSNGEPATAFLVADPNANGDLTSGTIQFSSWNHGQTKFNPPVNVAVAGNVGSAFAEQPFSVARDASNNLYGIAYVKLPAEELHIATSKDGGATWQDEIVPTAPATEIHSPSLQLFGGKVHVAWEGKGDGVRYSTGNSSEALGLWTSQLAPTQLGYPAPFIKVSLALDSAGAPGIAYMLGSDHSHDVHLSFWRPGTAAPITITGSNDQSTVDPDIELAFFGLNPRIAFAGALDSSYNADFAHTLWVSQSSDGGAHWTAPLNLPADMRTLLSPGISLTVGSLGQGAIATASNGGFKDNVCGTPKISLSDASFANWKTCGPVVGGNLDISSGTPSAIFGPNDRLYVVFQNQFKGTSLPYGVNLFAATVSSPTDPLITSAGVTNAASFKNSVSPGSLASLFGSNLALDIAQAIGTPLPTTLDAVSPVSLSVNGEKVPLLYVSPSQINFQIPWDIAVGTATVSVIVNGAASNTVSFPVLKAAPGIIVYGSNRAVATDPSGALLGTSAPAHNGSTIVVYMVGSGPVSNTPKSGEVSSATPLSYIQSSVSATVGAQPATVSFAGLASNYVGLVQLNLVIPAGLPSGDQPLIVTIDGVASNPAVINVAP